MSVILQGAALGFVTVPSGALRGASPAAQSAVAARRLSPALRPLNRVRNAILCATETATEELAATGGKAAESAWKSASVRLPRNARPDALHAARGYESTLHTQSIKFGEVFAGR